MAKLQMWIYFSILDSIVFIDKRGWSDGLPL